MLSGIVKTICRVGVFMICAQAIVHFRPKASYEKYLKILVSAMILLQLLAFVVGLFGTENEEKMFDRAVQYAQQLENSMQQAAEIDLFAGEETIFQMMGEPTGEESGEPEREIQNISIQIGDISPVQIEVNAGNPEQKRRDVCGSKGDVEEMVP